MAFKMVVAHDYGRESDRALQWASDFVRGINGELVLLHVILVPPPPIRKVPLIPALRLSEDPEESLRKLREIAEHCGVQAQVDVVETNDAGRGIVQRAKELGADAIAVAVTTPGRSSLARVFTGSVTDYIVHHAGCAVMAVPVSPTLH